MLLLAIVLTAASLAAAQPLNSTEVEVLKVFASKLGINWDFSVDPCSWKQIIVDPEGPQSGISCACPPTESTCEAQIVQKIAVQGMMVRGEIAPEIQNLTFLDSFDVQRNALTGVLPGEMGLLSNLQYITVNDNRLSGGIPSSFGNLNKLFRLEFGYNNFTGSLPNELSNLRLLSELLMESSGLSGELPQEISRLASLKKLHMSNNKFNGEIPEFLGEITTLEELKMTGNSFSGQIPSSLGNLTNLRLLSIGDVSSGGSIPASFGSLRNLANLTLRNCGLRGAIPEELGSLTQLTYMDLSMNNLSGHLPVSFGSLRSLETLNLAFNNLSGPPPKDIKNLNISGNRFDRARSSRNIAPIVLGIVIPVSILLVAVFLRWRRSVNRRKAYREEFEMLQRKPVLFSYREVKRATRNFSPENQLGKGGYGTVYKGTLSDGVLVALKQLSAKSSQGTSEFLTEVTIISSVQHRNLVKLHGCCIERSQRILVYEFCENNSLHHALWSGSDRRLLGSWPTRFNICVGIARGIAYLHEESVPTIVHRDIKASNVLLDRFMEPKIADFGLARLFKEHDSHISTQVAGTLGYIAPEYALRGQLSEKADVYSFGVLLLEIVSGRKNFGLENSPSHLEWAWNVLSENNVLVDFVDKSMSKESVIEEEVIKVVHVALLCGQAFAEMRPRMSDVVGMLVGDGAVDISFLRQEFFVSVERIGPGWSQKLSSDLWSSS